MNFDIFNILSNCFENFQNDINILKYVIVFVINISQINEIELFLKDYIENLAKNYKIYDISQIFSIHKKNEKPRARDVLKSSFFAFMNTEKLKKCLLDYYSFLYIYIGERNLDETGIQNHLKFHDEYTVVKKIVECIKYSEILFEFE